MSNSDDDPGGPDSVPDALLAQVNELDRTELQELLSYLEERIDALHPPLEEAITADTAGEVLDIEHHGGYALVRIHPPNPDGPGVQSDVVSVYHVRREQHPDGETDLHWAYIGDIQD